MLDPTSANTATALCAARIPLRGTSLRLSCALRTGRPGRRAHDAILSAQGHIQSGRKIVVDIDLEKFFDRVNHDILIDCLWKRIDDAGIIRLIPAPPPILPVV